MPCQPQSTIAASSPPEQTSCLTGSNAGGWVPYILLICLVAAVALLALAWWRERRRRREAGLLGEILDLADALERELLECRARLREIPALATALPPTESARATLTAEPLVQDALRDLLAHRLWLKDHAAAASRQELLSARGALMATHDALARQLDRLADVRSDLAQAAQAVRAAVPPR